ncbi:MAG: sensor histidine kinase [Anaerolineae bacterium]
MNDAVRLLRIALSIKLAPIVVISILGSLRFSWLPELVLLTTWPTVFVWIVVMLPGIGRRLGRYYLPVCIGLTVTAQTIETGLFAFAAPVSFVEARALDGPPPGVRALEPLFLLLVPTVLGAWAYGRRGAWLTAGLATVLVLITNAVPLLSGVPLESILPVSALRIAPLFLVGYIVGTLAEQQRKQTDALSAANAKLREQAAAMEQLAVARERNRLARDLHDTLAHSLAGLVVQLEAIDTLTREGAVPDQARSEIKKARRAAQAGLEDARRAIRDLRVNPVEDLGLTRTLEQAANDFGERTGVSVGLRMSEPKAAIANDIAAAIWRIAQEALNNVERHAGARRVEMTLAQANGCLVLSVADDGRGFDQAQIDEERFGLMGMRERAELIGGNLTIESQAGRGTSVRLVLSLK